MRFSILDGFRGYFLFMMMLVHMDGALNVWVRHLNHHPLGYVEDAQGFVFLSGLVIGLVYGRILIGSSASRMTKAVLARMGTIYLYHALLILFTTGLALWFVGSHIRPEILATFGEAPLTEGLAALLMLNGPNYIDILPMYVAFMAATPAALVAIGRGHELTVLLVSVALWLVAQSDVQVLVLSVLDKATGLSAQGGAGFGLYFNRFAWQVVYVLGLIAGMRLAQDRLDLSRLASREMAPLFVLAVIAVAGFFVLRRTAMALGTDAPGGFAQVIAIETERAHMPVLLLANFLADLFVVTWLLVAGPSSRFGSVRGVAHILRAVFTWKPFVFLGQHSLQVYAFHVFVLYLAYSLCDFSDLPRLEREALAVGFACSLFIPAGLHAAYTHWIKASRPANPNRPLASAK